MKSTKDFIYLVSDDKVDVFVFPPLLLLSALGMDWPGGRLVPEGNGKQREEKKGGKCMVVKSFVVPRRPSRLRDR